MDAIIATLRRSGLSFYFSISGVAGYPWVQNVFPDSEFGESFAHLFQTLAFAAVVFALWPWELKNRSGNYDLAAMVTMRRRHMKRTIKGVISYPEGGFLRCRIHSAILRSSAQGWQHGTACNPPPSQMMWPFTPQSSNSKLFCVLTPSETDQTGQIS